jgi:hypothetical protein
MFSEKIVRTIRVPSDLFHMEYCGKTYTIVRGIEPNSWKWEVRLDEKTARSGEAPTRAAAMNSIVWLVDKALASKKVK